MLLYRIPAASSCATLNLIDLDRLLVLAVSKPPDGLTALVSTGMEGERRHLDQIAVVPCLSSPSKLQSRAPTTNPAARYYRMQ